ncbi:MAG: HU family DNA-binding protein [Balneolia bacterium]|nr:HU family DNA-binding protein [Balneolia bacterium]
MRELLIRKLTDIIREGLANNENVTIEGLGTFSKKHIAAEEKSYPGGRVVMMPPKDVIEFKHEKE